jgi:hypothetical protein
MAAAGAAGVPDTANDAAHGNLALSKLNGFIKILKGLVPDYRTSPYTKLSVMDNTEIQELLTEAINNAYFLTENYMRLSNKAKQEGKPDPYPVLTVESLFNLEHYIIVNGEIIKVKHYSINREPSIVINSDNYSLSNMFSGKFELVKDDDNNFYIGGEEGYYASEKDAREELKRVERVEMAKKIQANIADAFAISQRYLTASYLTNFITKLYIT